MASYSVDSSRQPMTATGITEAVYEWEQTSEGRRRPSERQARDEDTGMPLWGVEVIYVQSAFGRESTATAKVTVGAPEQPRPAPLTPIGFTGLVVEARVNRSGGLAESWRAEAIQDGATPRTGKASTAGSQGGSSGSSSSAGESAAA